MKTHMMSLFRAVRFLLFAASATLSIGSAPMAAAQGLSTKQNIVQQIEARGFSNIAGLRRRGENYVFQARDPFGMKVRVVMNAKTGEIIGLSRVEPQSEPKNEPKSEPKNQRKK
jgi:hypothetical protein